jgi:hypothetical protein
VSAVVAGNASYQKVRLIIVDWDTHRGDPIVSELKVRRRSTLVMFSGGAEVKRVVAGTSKSAITSLFEAATRG